MGGNEGILNLSGARIYGSGLTSDVGSSAYTLFLCGARVLAGVDLTNFRLNGRLNAQGINTEEMILELVAGDIDLSAAKINELLLYLSDNPQNPSLKLTDSYIGNIVLPENHPYVPVVDARGATIIDVDGWVAVGELRTDERTHLDKDVITHFNYARLTTETPPRIYVR